MSNKVMNNRGTGAGGANTNLSGKGLEDYTHSQIRELSLSEIRHMENHTDFHNFCKSKGMEYSRPDRFTLWSKGQQPDGALVFENDNHIEILECKNQVSEGSVDEKLGFSHFLLNVKYRQLAEAMGYTVGMTYILSHKYKDPKYDDIIKYMKDSNVKVVYSDNIKEGINNIINER